MALFAKQRTISKIFTKFTTVGKCVNHVRCASVSHSFKSTDLEIQEITESQKKPIPDPSTLVFGGVFTNHMLEVNWNAKDGWTKPRISPLHNFSIHPGAKVLHYAIELFEGMKAYRGVDGKIRLFRPDANMRRMLDSARRCTLPAFDSEEMISCMKKLVTLDQEWVPRDTNSSLYIRPCFIGTEPTLGVGHSKEAILFVICSPVGPYFKRGVSSVSLLADPRFVRSWPGGCGDKKMGSNYAPTIAVQKEAEKMNLHQILWLYGPDHQLTEVGTMNIFIFRKNEKGEKELITPPLDGLILPGVTRLSLLELAKEWNEFNIIERTYTMKEVISDLKNERLLEIFGAGTACVVCPVNKIHYMSKDYNIPTMNHKEPLNIRFLKTLTGIQYGKIPHPWAVELT